MSPLTSPGLSPESQTHWGEAARLISLPAIPHLYKHRFCCLLVMPGLSYVCKALWRSLFLTIIMFVKIQLSLQDSGLETKLMKCKFFIAGTVLWDEAPQRSWGQQPVVRPALSRSMLVRGTGLLAGTPELASAEICSAMELQNKAEHCWEWKAKCFAFSLHDKTPPRYVSVTFCTSVLRLVDISSLLALGVRVGCCSECWAIAVWRWKNHSRCLSSKGDTLDLQSTHPTSSCSLSCGTGCGCGSSSLDENHWFRLVRKAGGSFQAWFDWG